MLSSDPQENPNLSLYSHLRNLHWEKNFSHADIDALMAKVESWLSSHHQLELSKKSNVNYDIINFLQTLTDNYLIHR